MVATLCLDSYAVYGADLGESQEPAIENQEVKEKPVKDEKAEKVEEEGTENQVPQREADKKLVKEEKEVQKEEAKEILDLGEEKVPEPVGVPEGFDLTTINTIAKDNAGNYYGVKTYNNNFDTTIGKMFYNLTEDEYNQVANDCFMVFKRQDGKAFKIPGALLGGENINDDTPNYSKATKAGVIFTEIQFRHHMAYRSGVFLNNDPTRLEGLDDIIWSIELKKDWIIEPYTGFAEDARPDYAYIHFNVDLDGKGHTIKRNDVNDPGIFQIGPTNSGAPGSNKIVTIKNLDIVGDDKYFGILLRDTTTLKLENTCISNCKTSLSSRGGGITLLDNTILNMDAKSSITGCKANRGGAIKLSDNVTVNINGSNISNNQADLGGAICSLKKDSTINVNGATFDGNKAVKTIDGTYLYGGAIYSQSNLNVEDSKFTNNSADGNGGAIYSYKAYTIKDSEFKNNSSQESGGAIYAPEDAPATISNTKFEENKATWGGAIYDKANSNIKNATFNKNQAKYYGGAIYTTKGTTVEDSHFIENQTLQGGGIYISDNAGNPTKVSNTRFEKNSVSYGGAGIFVDQNSKLEVASSAFTNNEGARGAGISSAANGNVNADLTNIKVDSSTFTDNLSLMGAGIFTAFPTEITKSVFKNNMAQVHPQDDKTNPHDSGVGGAIRVMDNKTTIKDSSFEDNFAGGSGGAIGINGVARDEDKNITTIKPNIQVEISEGTKFIGNTCGVGQGGAIFTIPYLYDIAGYETGVPEATLKQKAYKNLTTAADTVFKDNVALSGFVDPPANYANYANLKFKTNSFTEKLPNQIVAKSLLNNYDVNYKNDKLSAFFDPNGGEFTEGENPKDIRVVKGEKDKEIKLLEAPKREGYKFTGWKCSMNIPKDKLKEIPEETLKLLNEGKIYQAGEKFILDSNYIFIAQWEKAEKPTPKPDNKPTPKPTPRGSVFFVGPAPLLNKEDHAQYLIGYQDRTFGAENKMTREEVAVMFSRLLKNPPRKGQVYPYDFSDVARDRWSITAISYMNQLGIIKGYPDKTFKPEASITRAEFAAMAARFADLKEGTKTFTDLDKDYWAYDLIQRAASAGWITGYPDGTFKPDKNITRAEVVAITNRMLDRKADQDFVDQNLGKLLQFTDLDKSYWAYYPILEATNGHDYIRHENKLDEHWKEVTGKTFVYDK